MPINHACHLRVALGIMVVVPLLLILVTQVATKSFSPTFWVYVGVLMPACFFYAKTECEARIDLEERTIEYRQRLYGLERVTTASLDEVTVTVMGQSGTETPRYRVFLVSRSVGLLEVPASGSSEVSAANASAHAVASALSIPCKPGHANCAAVLRRGPAGETRILHTRSMPVPEMATLFIVAVGITAALFYAGAMNAVARVDTVTRLLAAALGVAATHAGVLLLMLRLHESLRPEEALLEEEERRALDQAKGKALPPGKQPRRPTLPPGKPKDSTQPEDPTSPPGKPGSFPLPPDEPGGPTEPPAKG